MKFALIKNGIVLNVIVSEQSFVDANLGLLGVDEAVEADGVYVGPGFIYSNGIFNPPIEEGSQE